MVYLNGSIGYTFLSNGDNKILVLADMHSTLPYCPKDGIFVSEWIKNKFKSKILLEEVPRENFELKELWASSPHTQKLKNLFINDKLNIINGVDIRPFLLPYSWELSFDTKTKDMILKDYLKILDLFYTLKLEYLSKNLKEIYTASFLYETTLGNHFLELKNKIKKYITTNNDILKDNVKHIYNNNSVKLEEINNIISDIMEWYIIAQIFKGIKEKRNKFIIHAGLAHTTNIINLLKEKYNYKIIKEEGITDMKQHNNSTNGCLLLSRDVEEQFGGFLYNRIKKNLL